MLLRPRCRHQCCQKILCLAGIDMEPDFHFAVSGIDEEGTDLSDAQHTTCEGENRSGIGITKKFAVPKFKCIREDENLRLHAYICLA